ncbi:hypothetical protein GCM10010174_58280 [Kutzneria viridogrisea]|uniref:Uncharacterized protein n=2 Tax=Kutzneria TaxID=43356 RepID=W5W3F8_9PSEU|nr:DUF5988 family protein [Kutzneria albida]AHH95315.1 hypothetical protein KALB_1945 [Kutzneria albida DSM 43870]MBA8927328.1 phage-related protein [Kutzneria viridogrisea]
METIRVLLSGGPVDSQEIDAVQHVDNLDHVLKFHRGNGYEHFRYTGVNRQLGEGSVPLYGWTGRTRIAE